MEKVLPQFLAENIMTVCTEIRMTDIEMEFQPRNIGQHFPDTDPRFNGADSGVLLVEAMARVRAAGFGLVNLDCTVVAQAPKLAPYMDSMVQRMAALLGVHPSQVNVKAKTAERLGPVGQGLSMEARAVVLLSGVGVVAGAR